MFCLYKPVVSLQEKSLGVSDGKFKGSRLFLCPSQHGLFVKLASCHPDSRFGGAPKGGRGERGSHCSEHLPSLPCCCRHRKQLPRVCVFVCLCVCCLREGSRVQFRNAGKCRSRQLGAGGQDSGGPDEGDPGSLQLLLHGLGPLQVRMRRRMVMMYFRLAFLSKYAKAL